MNQTSSIRKIVHETQYDAALARIDELLPLVSNDTPIDDPASVELVKISKLVADYEDVHYPIGNENISGRTQDLHGVEYRPGYRSRCMSRM